MSKQYIKLVLLILMLSGKTLSAEELLTKVINLNYRQADDVISLLQPFVHPKGVLSADGYRILVKTTPQNFKDLQMLVAEIDVSMRQIRITVTLDSQLVQQESKPISEDEAIKLDEAGQTFTTQERDKDYSTQQIGVIEGKWATISTGESVPVGKRTRNPDGTITESISYRSINKSLKLLPRISGQNVTLYIKPHFESETGSGDRTQTQSADTTVTGKLNEWILIGGVSRIEIDRPGSRIYSTEKRVDNAKNMFVKVEVIQ